VPEAMLALDQTPMAAAEARSFLSDALEQWGGASLAEVAELLVTEVVANAVRHAGPPIALRACYRDHELRVEVRDPSPALPSVEARGLLAESGRGMQIVSAFADRHGAETLPSRGKVVWFELADSSG
jgi:anti-sigma regulatory factor (Ser/Thr protein kinase)